MHTMSMRMNTNARPWKPRRLLRRPREMRTRSRRRPRLRFSPTAWAKLLFVRDRGPTEVGGFGITSADDLLYVEDIHLVKQVCTSVSVVFDDAAVAEFFDEQIDAPRKPEQFGRIWIHTHPGRSPKPSHVDEETFARVFGPCDWAVMFILAREGEDYCRLRFRAGPGGEWEISVGIDFQGHFAGSNCDAWAKEYEATVRQPEVRLTGPPATQFGANLAALAETDDLFDSFWESFDWERRVDLHEHTL
jgi:proteasome lid subunit RPN8/RPN11